MSLQQLLHKMRTMTYASTVQECISEIISTKKIFICLTDTHGKYLGDVYLYDLIASQPSVNIYNADIPIRQSPQVFLDGSASELLNPDNLKEIDHFIVVDQNRLFLGIIKTQEYLAQVLSQQSLEQAQINELLEALGYRYFSISQDGTVHGSRDAYNLLNTDPNRPFTISNLSHGNCVHSAIANRTSFRNIEVNYNGQKFLMNILPDSGKHEKTWIALEDTARNYFFLLFNTIFSTLAEGLTIVNEKGIITYCNLSSARYIHRTPDDMIGHHISGFYPFSVLLKVIETHKSYPAYHLSFNGQVYIVRGIPFFVDGIFKGGISIFQEITEIIQLMTKNTAMENQLSNMKLELNISKHSDVFNNLIGSDGSLKEIVEKSQRCMAALGGPRHCIITGETGTGKTTLAKSMYEFATKIEIIKPNAPFIEVNCAQFTNNDIAALEIFGSERGSFTGAIEKQGLIELANGGVLFLDEAHALGAYQTMLLKVIEDGVLRRIGGRIVKKLDIIIIAASSQNLKDVLLPELYQRLAQYQIHLSSLHARPVNEKKSMLYSFCRYYEESSKKRYGIQLKITISPQAESLLLTAYYPRNIREFRDVVNSSIDAAVPLVSSVRAREGVIWGIVELSHLPKDLFDKALIPSQQFALKEPYESPAGIDDRISALNKQGLGPRKIAKLLQADGVAIEYYQVAYRLKNLKANN